MSELIKSYTNPEEIEKIKQEIKELLKSKGVAVVGRIESWLNNSDSRYPVSCTVFDVQDSMEGKNGIEESWLYASKGLRYGAGVAFNLSNIRPRGHENGKGLTASGPVSFMEIYSALNKVLRRGGIYKNGACLRSNTYVATDSGYFQISDLVGKSFKALVNGKLYPSTEGGFWSSGTKKVYKLVTKKGYEVESTADHKFVKAIRANNYKFPIEYKEEWTELQDLKEGDLIKLSSNLSDINNSWEGKYNYQLGWLVGNWYGDGYFDQKRQTATLSYNGEAAYLEANKASEYLKEQGLFNKVNQTDLEQESKIIHLTANGKDTYKINNKGLYNFLTSLGFTALKAEYKEEALLSGTSSDFYKGFISGFFDADGTVVIRSEGNRCDLKAYQQNESILKTIQKMLIRLGIVSSISKDEYFTDKVSTFTNSAGVLRTIKQKALYTLSISGTNISRFNSLIGFEHPIKKAKLDTYLSLDYTFSKNEYFIDSIKSIEYVGEEEVFDCTIEEVHEFSANGIRVHNCVAYLDYNHPDIYEFLNANGSEYAWIKKAVYVDEEILKEEHRELLSHILDKVRDGTIWLAKKRWDEKGNRLFSQVCTEILLRSNATCLLMHTNLGDLEPWQVPDAMMTCMIALCKLHSITGAGKDNMYLTPEEDRQVGLGVIGLANFLAQNQVTYKDFVTTSEQIIEFAKEYNYKLVDAAHILNSYLIFDVENSYEDSVGMEFASKAFELVTYILEGFNASAMVAREYEMDRAFTIAPTASCSYRYKDLNGYTTTPEISPPICHPVTKISTRDSGTFGAVDYQYPPTVETAEEVGWDIYYRLVKVWQTFMEDTGLAHAISFNIWNTCPVDIEWFKDWMASPLVTTYYRMMVQQDYVDKTTIAQGVDSSFLDTDFFLPVDEQEGQEDKSELSFLKSWQKADSSIETEAPDSAFCPIGCESCAE